MPHQRRGYRREEVNVQVLMRNFGMLTIPTIVSAIFSRQSFAIFLLSSVVFCESCVL